jgi:hypothetical protein
MALAFELSASHLLRQALHLEPLYQLILVIGFLEIGSQELFTRSWL